MAETSGRSGYLSCHVRSFLVARRSSLVAMLGLRPQPSGSYNSWHTPDAADRTADAAAFPGVL